MDIGLTRFFGTFLLVDRFEHKIQISNTKQSQISNDENSKPHGLFFLFFARESFEPLKFGYCFELRITNYELRIQYFGFPVYPVGFIIPQGLSGLGGLK